MKFITLTDKYDPLATRFRQRIYLECGAREEHLEQNYSVKQIREVYSERSEMDIEELYKFGKQKWGDTAFDRIEAALDEDEVVSISGCRFYGDRLLRVAMHHYTLHPFRDRYRGMLFRQDGFFERHLDYALSKAESKFIFFSVYVHNRKLLAATRNMSGKCFSPEGLGMKTLKGIFALPEPIRLNNVDQHIFAYSLRTDSVCEREFKGELAEALGGI